MKKRKPLYSTHTKVEALAELDRSGDNLYQTAKKLGIPPATLGRWRKERERAHQHLPADVLGPLDDHAPLDEQLEQIVHQMVAIMPEKLEQANLQELARSLTLVLTTMNQARAEKEPQGEDVYEKLARLMDHYAAAGAAGGGVEPTDGN